LLFYNNKGTFSRDVAEPAFENYLVPSILWNTLIEGASREGASTQVLVTVEVSGEYAATRLRQIEFTARYKPIEGRREMFIRRLIPIRIGESGNYIAGFWLDNAGCNTVRLSARIVGQKQPSLTKRFIKFGWGVNVRYALACRDARLRFPGVLFKLTTS
jgi:hypothetical protein